MKNIVLGFIFALVCFLFPVKSLACSCPPMEVPVGMSEAEEKEFLKEHYKKEFDKTTVVFSGEVIEAVSGEMGETRRAYARVKFKVRKIWKGVETQEIEVFAFLLCDEFSPGESFLVYASALSEKDKRLWTSRCAGTLPLESAGYVLKYIGEGKEIKPEKQEDAPRKKPRS